MLTPTQQQAIVRCLTGIDQHAHHHYPWPGPMLLAALRETPVAGHPDPTARHLGVMPVPVPPSARQHTDDPVQALREVAADLHSPTNQAIVALADGTDVRVLAWTFMHAIDVSGTDSASAQARVVEAADIDNTVYVLTHLPGQPDGQIGIHDAASDAAIPETLTVLRALAHSFRTG
jgi:hypothetical protein